MYYCSVHVSASMHGMCINTHKSWIHDKGGEVQHAWSHSTIATRFKSHSAQSDLLSTYTWVEFRMTLIYYII